MVLGNPHELPCGRTRVRLPYTSDARAIVGLLRRLGLAADELEVRRAVRFDPRRRTAVVATCLRDGQEVALGIALGRAVAETVLAEDADVARLLETAVRERAAALAA